MSAVTGVERIFTRAKKLAKDARDRERPLKASSVYMLGSIEKTFRAQGRPNKWQPLSAKTLAGRRRGRGKGGAQILIDKGLLKNAHSYRLTSDASEIGSNKVQGPRQHFGYKGGKGRGRSKTPARPWMMFQKEDVREIGEIFSRHYRS